VLKFIIDKYHIPFFSISLKDPKIIFIDRYVYVCA